MPEFAKLKAQADRVLDRAMSNQSEFTTQERKEAAMEAANLYTSLIDYCNNHGPSIAAIHENLVNIYRHVQGLVGLKILQLHFFDLEL